MELGSWEAISPCPTEQRIVYNRQRNRDEFTANEETGNEENEHPINKQAPSSVGRSSRAHKPSIRSARRDHPEDLIIGNLDEGMKLRQTTRKDVTLLALLIEPNLFKEAYEDENWNKAMQDELEQIKKSETWELISRPKDKNVIGTKWVFKNKLNEDGNAIRNKARLVCKGYAQVEGLD